MGSGLTDVRREREPAAVICVGVLRAFLVSVGEMAGVAARREVVADFGEEDGPAGASGT